MCLRTLVDRKWKCLLTQLIESNFVLQPIEYRTYDTSTFNLVTSSAFLIQQDDKVVDEFRQHGGVVTVIVKLSPQGFA